MHRNQCLESFGDWLGAILEYYMRTAEMNVVLRSLIIAVVITAAWAPFGWPLLRAKLEARRARREQAAGGLG